MAVFLKGTNALIGRLIGLVTIFVGIVALTDRFIIGSLILMGAGAFLYFLESRQHSALVAFVIRALFIGMVFFGSLFISL